MLCRTMAQLLGLGAVAGMIPVFLGILAALYLKRVLPRSLEGLLIGVASGVLTYLFFDPVSYTHLTLPTNREV